MPETPEELYERAKDTLRVPPLEEWETWPFEGDVRPRPLAAPIAQEEPRVGAGGRDCWACDASDDAFLWTDERWRLVSPKEPHGLPLVVLLMPRTQYADPGDLPDDLARELGVLLARIERAVRSVGEIGRVHVCRWGDGSEHLHWWFIARPARMPQLSGSFAAIWDDVLPPLPPEVHEANVASLRATLG